MSVYIVVYSCFSTFVAYTHSRQTFGPSRMFVRDRRAEIDRSPVLGALLKICDLSTRYGERRSVKLFAHSCISRISSSLKYFDYSRRSLPPPSSLPLARPLSLLFTLSLTCTHARIHMYILPLLPYTSLPLFSLLPFPSVILSINEEEYANTRSERSTVVLKKNNLFHLTPSVILSRNFLSI